VYSIISSYVSAGNLVFLIVTFLLQNCKLVMFRFLTMFLVLVN